MKEDAQLICPISFEDTSGLWNLLEENLLTRFPLKDISCKNPINGNQIIIEKLPLRCIPSNASIFKDSDHPFRWFLAPYIQIYVISCESNDAYKAGKPKLRQWVEARTSPKRASWLILYLPLGTQPIELYQKIYSKLASDFYQDKSGDRTSIIYLKGFQSRGAAIQPPNLQISLNDLVNKIRDGVIASFLQRCANYDSEIRRLDGLRGTADLDFRQLFLVKESLALMYQMMQMPNESLVQYEELEALLSFASLAPLPTNEWPLIPVDIGATQSKRPKPPQKTTRDSTQSEDVQDNSTLGSSSSTIQAAMQQSNNNDNNNNINNNNSDQSSSSSTTTTTTTTSQWVNAYQQGNSLLMYSINHSRMKVLKNKISIIELTHYVFARQTFFLLSLGKLSICAEKGYRFITTMYNLLIKKLEEVKRVSAIDDLKNAVLDREKRIESPTTTSLTSNDSRSPITINGNSTTTTTTANTNTTNNNIPLIHLAGRSSSFGGLHSTQLPINGLDLNDNSNKSKLKEMTLMIGLWAVVSAIQMIRGCREHIHTALTLSTSTNTQSIDNLGNSPAVVRARSISGTSSGINLPGGALSLSSNVLDASPLPSSSSSHLSPSHSPPPLTNSNLNQFPPNNTTLTSSNSSNSALQSPSSTLVNSTATVATTTTTTTTATTATATTILPSINETLASKIRDSSRYLSDLLFFAKDILLNIFQYQQSICNPNSKSNLNSNSTSNSPLMDGTKIKNSTFFYEAYRKLSIELTQEFQGWDNFDLVVEKFPSIFLKNSLQSDDDLLPSVLSRSSNLDNNNSNNGVGNGNGNESKSTRESLTSGNGKQKLFGESIENLEESAGNFNRKLLKYVNELCDKQSNFNKILASDQSESIISEYLHPTNRSELSELASDLTVIINRLIAEHEEIAGRWRFASKAKIECADVLICRGKFSLAQLYIQSAITNSPLVTSIITPIIQLPSNPSHSSSSHFSFFNTNSFFSHFQHDSLLFWGQLRIWTLRKKLLCSRYLHNRLDYIKTLLSLLEPSLCKYLPLEYLTILQSDLVKISEMLVIPINSPSSTPKALSSPSSPSTKKTGITKNLTYNNNNSSNNNNNNNNNSQNRPIIVSSDHHFSFTIMMNTPHYLKDKEPIYPCMIVSNTTKTLHDENFQVRIAKCIAGQPYTLYLRIKNEFPQPIEVDDIIVTYTQFHPSILNGHHLTSPSSSLSSTSTSSTTTTITTNTAGGTSTTLMNSSKIPSATNIPITKSSSLSNIPINTFSHSTNSSFECRPIDIYKNESKKYRLESGDQVLELLFSPLAVGEYMLQKIVVRVSGVFFEKHLSTDINRLQSFFSSNILVSVTPPTRVFQVETHVPSFTPINQKDNFGLTINAQPNDRIETMFVKFSIQSALSLSSPSSSSNNSNIKHIQSRDTNDIGFRIDSLNVPFTSKDTNFYENPQSNRPSSLNLSKSKLSSSTTASSTTSTTTLTTNTNTTNNTTNTTTNTTIPNNQNVLVRGNSYGGTVNSSLVDSSINSNGISTTSSSTLTTTTLAPGSLSISLNSPIFEMSSPNSWIVKCVKFISNDSSALLPVSHNSRVDLKTDGILITELSNTQQLNLVIPYNLSLPTPQYPILPQPYTIKYSIQGTLTRNSCLMDYEMSDSFLILGGEQLLIEQNTTELFGDEYFCQFILTNISKNILKLLPYQISSYQTNINHYEIIIDEENISIPSSGIILLPNHKYYIGIKLKFVKAILPITSTNSRQSSLKHSFLYPNNNQENSTKLNEKYQSILSQPPKLIDIIFPVQRYYVKSEYKGINLIFNNLLPLFNSEEYFNQTIFSYSLTINSPQVLLPSIEPLLKIDYSLNIELTSDNIDDNNNNNNSSLISQHLRHGEPIMCIYTLKLIFPTSTSPISSTLSPNIYNLCLKLDIGRNHFNQSVANKWMALGITTREVTCTTDNPVVKFPIQLIPIVSGTFSFPPLLVSMKSSTNQLSDVIPIYSNNQVVIQPNHRVVVVLSSK